MGQEIDATFMVEENGDSRPLAVEDFGDVADSLGDGRKVVAAAGTAEALVGSSTPALWVCITALKSNTEQVCVGGADVVAAEGSETGQPLDAKEWVTLPVKDVAEVYVDAVVNGEGVTFTYGIRESSS